MAAKRSGSKRATLKKTGTKRGLSTKKAATKKPKALTAKRAKRATLMAMTVTAPGRALVLKGGSFGLRTVGDIYYDLAPAGAEPVAANVILNAPQDEHPLALAPGKYDYRFDIGTGSGNIQLSVRQRSGVETQPQTFSSGSPLGLHYRFKVS